MRARGAKVSRVRFAVYSSASDIPVATGSYERMLAEMDRLEQSDPAPRGCDHGLGAGTYRIEQIMNVAVDD